MLIKTIALLLQSRRTCTSNWKFRY